MSITPGPWEAVCVGVGGSRDNPTDLYEVTTAYAKIAEYLSEADAKAIAEVPAMIEALQAIVHQGRAMQAVGDTSKFADSWLTKAAAILKRIEG